MPTQKERIDAKRKIAIAVEQNKYRARSESLMHARSINNSTHSTEDFLKEAEKIYQWLIKDL